jgi:CubicO group peptidase (beta-lactamase class C family)
MRSIADIPADAIARIAMANNFSGVISVAPLAGGTSVEAAFGLADRANRIPNATETRFAMASGCKGFTAAAIWMLIEAERIALDTRLSECVASRQFHFGDKVTIGQLLNHTSGIPDYFSEEIESDYAALWRERPCYGMKTVQDFLPLFEGQPMKAPPGQGFLYNNAGFILLGLVVEELTGQDFRTFVAERILGPCDMTRSGYFAMDALPEKCARGYLSPDPADYHTNIYAVPAIGGPDGGAFTTAGDLRRFWASLLSGRLLAPTTVERLISAPVRVSDDYDDLYYGYGVWLRQSKEGWIVSLEGGDPGVALESLVWIDHGIVATVLSNVTGSAAEVSNALAELLTGHRLY